MALKNTRAGNYPEWYQNVVSEADMAENSSSPGCMVIKPWGYGIWERIRDALTKNQIDRPRKLLFPMFIPLSFFRKKPNMLTVLPRKWPLSRIRACR